MGRLVYAKLLNTLDHFLPQQRQRYYIIGMRSDMAGVMTREQVQSFCSVTMSRLTRANPMLSVSEVTFPDIHPLVAGMLEAARQTAGDRCLDRMSKKQKWASDHIMKLGIERWLSLSSLEMDDDMADLLSLIHI